MKQLIIMVIIIIMAIAIGIAITSNLQPAATNIITRTVTDVNTVNP
jgi:hypothetical protein